MSEKTKKYVTRLPHYRQSVYVPAGAVIEVPVDEKPSVSWDELKGDDLKLKADYVLEPLPEAGAAAKAGASVKAVEAPKPAAPAPAKQGRPSDREV